jgi:hypothetical protein
VVYGLAGNVFAAKAASASRGFPEPSSSLRNVAYSPDPASPIAIAGIELIERLPKLSRLVLWKAQRVDDSAVPYLNAMVRLEYVDVAENAYYRRSEASRVRSCR